MDVGVEAARVGDDGVELRLGEHVRAVGSSLGSDPDAGRPSLGVRGAYVVKSTPRAGMDQSRTATELGISPPPLDDTVRDTVSWLVASGHVPAKAAGRRAQP